MKGKKGLYVIGNASEEFIRKCLEKDSSVVGAGYKGEWFVDVSECVKSVAFPIF